MFHKRTPWIIKQGAQFSKQTPVRKQTNECGNLPITRMCRSSLLGQIKLWGCDLRHSMLIKTSSKGFSASQVRWRELDTFKILEIFWKFFGYFWEFFRRIFLKEFLWRNFLEGFFWTIFWEDFFGRIFLGGFFGRIFWEEFFGRNLIRN